jgi:hypothetical protein
VVGDTTVNVELEVKVEVSVCVVCEVIVTVEL